MERKRRATCGSSVRDERPWLLSEREAQTQRGCSDVALAFLSIDKVPFQTRCRLQEVIEQGFPNPGFSNPGLVDTHHVLVHLYSEIGPSARC